MRNAWVRIRDSKLPRLLLKFSLAISVIEIAVLLYFYDVNELLSLYLGLTGLDKYVS